jgi:hypothetical protein
VTKLGHDADVTENDRILTATKITVEASLGDDFAKMVAVADAVEAAIIDGYVDAPTVDTGQDLTHPNDRVDGEHSRTRHAGLT